MPNLSVLDLTGVQIEAYVGTDGTANNENNSTDSIEYQVNEIPIEAFGGKSVLTSVTFPPTLTSIREMSFYNAGLTSVTLPEGLITIGGGAFMYCFSLTSVTVPASVTSWGYIAFYNCYKLTSVTFSKGLTTIGSSAFSYCFGLTSITLPEGLTTIESRAFHGCSNLKSVTLPSTVDSLGIRAFYGYVNVSTENPNFTTYQNILYDKNITRLIYCPTNRTGKINSPSTVQAIDPYAFEGCSVTLITLPEGLTTIGEYAFSNCSSISPVTIPISVTSWDNAFNGTNITAVTLKEGLTNIGSYAFSGSSIKSITIPASVTSWGGVLFLIVITYLPLLCLKG